MVGALLACLAGAAAVTAFQTRAYESSATVLISFPGQTDPSQLYYGTQAAQDRLPSYAAIAGGRAIAARAVAHYDLPISAEALVSKTRVLYIPKSLMFTITVTDTDPNRAAALTKAMADEFVEVVRTLGVNPKGTLRRRRAPTASLRRNLRRSRQSRPGRRWSSPPPCRSIRSVPCPRATWVWGWWRGSSSASEWP